MKSHLCKNRFLVEKILDKMNCLDLEIYKEKDIWYYSYWDAGVGERGSNVTMIVFACPLCGVKLK